MKECIRCFGDITEGYPSAVDLFSGSAKGSFPLQGYLEVNNGPHEIDLCLNCKRSLYKFLFRVCRYCLKELGKQESNYRKWNRDDFICDKCVEEKE